MIVYFSNVSNNTSKFVEKLDMPALRLPIKNELISVDYSFILITPTYGASGSGYVPKQVIKFLNDENNRKNLKGVIASGNTNFGQDYCKAGQIISARCNVPLLYRFELMGLKEDVINVQEGIETHWETLTTTN